MNPLAHVTQTHFTMAQSHWGHHKHPVPVDICRHVHPEELLNNHMCTRAGTQKKKKRHLCKHIHAHSQINSAQTQSNKTHTKHRPQRPACGRWTFYVVRQRPSWSRNKNRERAKLEAKYWMFDLTERYFQNRIQKFQPSGHNYLFSKLRFSSFAIMPMSCDTDTRRASVWVIYWLAVCCYEVGAEKKGPPINQTGRKAGSQVARQATRINTHSLSWECSP